MSTVHAWHRSPLLRGVLFAIAAAVSFGLSTPLVQLAGQDLGAFTTATLLYLGSAGFAALIGGARPLPRARWPILGVIAFFGAFAAPAFLAAGLARSSGTSASLMLNLEAVFTVLLGALVHREAVGRRVWVAVAVIAGGGALLALDRADGGMRMDLGLLLVAGATLSWALDNTVARALTEEAPEQVVLSKSALGVAFSLLVALLLREPMPTAPAALALMACGAIGYGASLRFYLLAQRSLGSARTGSVFAVGPFVGALAAAALGQPPGGWLTVAGGLAIAVGVYLHLTEQHDHEHSHPAQTHTHPHRHDDDHHDHTHPGLDPGIVHSHEHDHVALAHAHPHGEDLHHRHH